MKIKNNIKFFREEKQLTQKELAKMSKTSERNIQSIEAGSDPRISTVLKISEALETSIEDLFGIHQHQLRETSLNENK